MLVYIDTASAVNIFAPGGSLPRARRSASASYESLRLVGPFIEDFVETANAADDRSSRPWCFMDLSCAIKLQHSVVMCKTTLKAACASACSLVRGWYVTALSRWSSKQRWM
eukprot:scaffold3556_cov67-Attheya_sp.AAC.1